MKTAINLTGLSADSVADLFANIGWKVVEEAVHKPPIMNVKIIVDNGDVVLVLSHEEGKPKGGFLDGLLYTLKGKACVALQKVGML
jgi:hypothetical protein